MDQPDQQSNHRWFHDRFPVSKYLKTLLHEEIPGGASFSYSLGSAALFLFFLLVLTGIWQMFVYVPAVSDAYESLCYLRLDVPFGWLLHGLHYWGANAFAIVIALHMIRVFIWGAYKKPRELVWIAGIFLLFLSAAFMYTGPILPWDKKGFWACKVGMDIIGAIPWIGSILQAFFQGTQYIGQATLSRMFVWHVAILPFLMVSMVAVHLIAFRVAHSAGTWNKEKQKIKGQFWPQQIYKDMLIAFFIFILLVGLSVYFPPPFSGMVDPLDTTYIPKPEWNFVFLYQLLKYFKGSWEPIGIVGIPLILFLLFISLPFIDRNQERDPFKRLFVISTGLLFVVIILILTIFNFRTSIPSELKVSEQSLMQSTLEKKKSLGPQMITSSQGEKLFYANNCNTCHSIDGKPSNLIGPDLLLSLSKKKNLTREWLEKQLVSPEKNNPNTVMPSYSNLSKEDISSLVDFLEEISKKSPEQGEIQSNIPKQGGEIGTSVNMIGNYRNGKYLYDQYCLQCHGPNGKIDSEGFVPVIGVPPLNPMNKNLFSEDVSQFLQKIDSFIQKGAPNSKGGPAMLAFGLSHFLTQEQIADIEAYLLHINHVDRAKINNPGMDPKHFFYILLGIAATFFVLGIIFKKIKKI